MKTLTRILAATAIALPLTVFAQSTTATPKGITPADQPTSQLEKDATTKNGQAPKYGTPATDTGGASTSSGMTKPHKDMAKHEMTKHKDTTPPGDAPTYPAPAKDGTPTK